MTKLTFDGGKDGGCCGNCSFAIGGKGGCGSC